MPVLTGGQKLYWDSEELHSNLTDMHLHGSLAAYGLREKDGKAFAAVCKDIINNTAFRPIVLDPKVTIRMDSKRVLGLSTMRMVSYCTKVTSRMVREKVLGLVILKMELYLNYGQEPSKTV